MDMTVWTVFVLACLVVNIHGFPDDLTSEELQREEKATANTTVCYDYVGCFSNEAPFNNAADELPASPEHVGTIFMLYTRASNGSDDFELLSYENGTLVTNTSFDASRKTKVIVHGFNNFGFEPWIIKMRDAFLQIEDCNVIVLDWHNGAQMPMYDQAVANTRLVGRQTRLVLERLVEEMGLDLNDVHLVGHSLGAHTSGYCGRELGGKLYRITGLDPAAPEFDQYSTVLDLDASDAQFVDIIHSNARPLASGGVGLYHRSGSVDFYLNGGRTQPGCRDGLSALLDIFKEGIGNAVACSHMRAHEVFVESLLTECSFTAYPCDSYESFEAGLCLGCGEQGCSELGLYADQHPARGPLYLITRADPPYCGFHYAVTIQASNTSETTSGQLSVQLNGTWAISDYVPVTEREENLRSGAVYSGLVVSASEVGRLRSLTIRYDKAAGWLWGLLGGGKDHITVDAVTVVSGESGEMYKFCLEQTQLLHQQEVTLALSDADRC